MKQYNTCIIAGCILLLAGGIGIFGLISILRYSSCINTIYTNISTFIGFGATALGICITLLGLMMRYKEVRIK